LEYEGEEYEMKVDDNITTFTVGLGYRMDSGLSILAGYRGDVHNAKETMRTARRPRSAAVKN